MYGLRSAPRSWQDHLNKVLLGLGLKKCKSDPSLYVSSDGVYVLVHVDDMLITGDTDAVINFLVEKLQGELLLKKVDFITVDSAIRFLGRNITHHGDTITIWVGFDYIDSMVKAFELNKTSTRVSTTTGAKLKEQDDLTTEDLDDPEVKAEEPVYGMSYRSITGKLQWLTGCRPDIQYAVKEIARDCNNVQNSSWTKVKPLLR